MEAEFKNMIFAMALSMLFGVLILTVVYDVGSDYGKDMTDVTGGALDLTSFNATIGNLQSNAESFQERFQSGSVWSALAGVVVDGIFGIGVDIVKILISPLALINGILLNIFGFPPIIVGTITALFIFAIIFALWRLIKIGD